MNVEGHVVEAPHPVEHPHPGPRLYVIVAVILAIVTGIEVAIVYMHELAAVLVPTLLVLSAAKFATVVMFYMHLKFDAKFFSGFFVSGLMLAVLVVVALLALFNNLVPTIGQV